MVGLWCSVGEGVGGRGWMGVAVAVGIFQFRELGAGVCVQQFVSDCVCVAICVQLCV
mgnify:CR=1 FL=1